MRAQNQHSFALVTYNADWQRSQLQPYHHWQEASPYCKGVLHVSLLRILDFGLKDKDETPLEGKVCDVKRTLYNCINRAGFLTETAIDALRHVDI